MSRHTASRIQLDCYFSVDYYFFFRIKQGLLIVLITSLVISLSVYIVSLSADITKIGIRPHHCRLTRISLVSIKTNKEKSCCCIINCFQLGVAN